MQINPLTSSSNSSRSLVQPPIADSDTKQPEQNATVPSAKTDELKETFQDFVGQTLFAQMLKAMRSTQQPSKYFHGGRAEEIFQGQLDQILTEEISDASASTIAEPMYDLFMLRRQP